MKLLSVSNLRKVNARYLKAMKEPEFIVVTEKGKPQIKRALIPYGQFMQMQAMYRDVLRGETERS